MLWYRETDKWKRDDIRGNPLPDRQLRPKSGTKWHIVDEQRSSALRVFAACGSGLGDLVEMRDNVLLENPVKIQPGMSIPTPGHGAACTRCLRLAVRYSGS